VSYVVLEAGSWELADGTRLEVGLLSTDATVGRNVANEWATVRYSRDFPSSPAAFSQVQTDNDPTYVSTRQQNRTSSSFQVALEEEEAATAPHAEEEVVGWLAFEVGMGTWSGRPYEVRGSAKAVFHQWYLLPFWQSFSQAPRFLAALSTYDDDDNAHLRYKRSSLTSSGVEVRVEEDKSYDSETDHGTERVVFLAIEGDGALTGKVYVPGSERVTKYYGAGGTRVAMRENGTLYWLLADHLGSTSVVAHADGTKKSEMRYNAWGETRYASGETPTSYRYTGQRQDAYIKLYFYGSRYYDPALARFVQADTVVPDGNKQAAVTPLLVGAFEVNYITQVNAENQENARYGFWPQRSQQARKDTMRHTGPADPQALNRYSYCLNNPLRYRDPSGHDSAEDYIGYEIVEYYDDGTFVARIWCFEEELWIKTDWSDVEFLAFKDSVDKLYDAESDMNWGSIWQAMEGIAGGGGALMSSGGVSIGGAIAISGPVGFAIAIGAAIVAVAAHEIYRHEKAKEMVDHGINAKHQFNALKTRSGTYLRSRELPCEWYGDCGGAVY
jgi:RHS repeat-associated protein